MTSLSNLNILRPSKRTAILFDVGNEKLRPSQDFRI